MKKFFLLSFIVIGTFAFSAEKTDNNSTVKFYKMHLDIAKEKVEACKLLNKMTDEVADDCTRANTALIMHDREMHKIKYSKKDIEDMRKAEGDLNTTEK